MARILVPLPDRDFDTTEVAVPWRVLSDAGHELVFATEAGAVAACDPLLLRGVLFGKLGAADDAKACYAAMIAGDAFNNPLRWDGIVPDAFDALLLPGGHAPGMRQYLGSDLLRRRVAAFALLGRPIAAICHGVLVLARAAHPGTGESLLAGRCATCLPRYMEALAHRLTSWKLGRYYRTYDAYVEEEVRLAVGPRGCFVRGPLTLGARGTESDDRAAFVVKDGQFLTARWPGDAWLFARQLAARLDEAAALDAFA
jgi:putative intracellular protease/amidase